jgi:hypothetical protein
VARSGFGTTFLAMFVVRTIIAVRTASHPHSRRLAVAELKTKKTNASVDAFLRRIADPKQREDSFTVLELMKDVTGQEPKMWGTSIVGFGSYHYKYPTGREGEWMITGFSPRKGTLTLYCLCGAPRQAALLKKLGKYKTGVSCLYIKRLADIDLPTLRELVRESFAHVRQRFESQEPAKSSPRMSQRAAAH